MYNMENIYFSLYDYILLVEKIINRNIIINKDFNITINNFKDEYTKFTEKNNLYNPNVIYEFDFSESLVNFIKHKFELRDISKTYGYFNRSFSEKQLISYINCHNTFTEKPFVMRVIIAQKSFILRFIINKISQKTTSDFFL